MNNLLRKLKLIETITFQLDTTKSDFIKSFEKNVDESDLSFSDGMFEALTSSKNEYKGTIDRNSFKIRRRRKFFDTNRNMFAVASGELLEKDSQLYITTEITGFHNAMKFLYILFGAMYLIFLIGLILTSSMNKTTPPLFIIIPFLLIHATLMLGIPFFLMKRSVQRMKYELERDFHFWLKK